MRKTPRAIAMIAAVLSVLVAGCAPTAEEGSESQGGLIVSPRYDDDEDGGDETARESQQSITDVSFSWWDGTPASGAELLGTPTVINFFASSCAPCRQELPDFESVSQRYAGDVRFVGIATGDERKAAQQLIDDSGITFDVGEDIDNSMFVSMGGFVLPTTYFVNADGAIVNSHLGAMTGAQLEESITTELNRKVTP